MDTFCCAILATIATIALKSMGSSGGVDAYTTLDISDPVTYAQFKSGEIGQHLDIVNILPNAHPTPLHEPPHFANATHFKLTFSDGFSQITLFPRNQAVLLTHSHNVSFAMPDHYKEYEYEVRPTSMLSDGDIDFLATCKEATSFGFTDAGDVTIRLIHRIVQWNKNLRKLKSLRMSVSRQFLWSTSFRPYLGFMVALEAAAFEFHDMSTRQIEKFVRKQGIAGGWIRHGSNAKVVAYHKEGQISTPTTNFSRNSSIAEQTHHKFTSIDLNEPASSSPPGQITIIDTPRAYEAFKRHEYAVNAPIVRIEAGAHANLLTEVKHFWNATNHLIRFGDIDHRRNYVTLAPINRRIAADFHQGFNLTLGLPANYVNYTLTFSSNAIITVADMEHVLTWTSVRYLAISDECNVAQHFLKRIDALKAMQDLEMLRLDIHAYAMPAIILKPFFDTLAKLKRIDFAFRGNVSWLSRERFIRRQAVPGQFRRVKSRPATLSYVKK